MFFSEAEERAVALSSASASFLYGGQKLAELRVLKDPATAMHQCDTALSIHKHVRRSGVDLEGLCHPAILVVGSRIDERFGSLFDKSLDVRSGVGESNGDDTEFRRLVVSIEFTEERQITLT